MTGGFLVQAAVFLAAAAIAAPLAKRLQISSVLGYLGAGVLIGPYGLGIVYTIYEVETILDFAELGVALLLFLIGLELKPQRLWTMRGAILGLGAAQVAASALLLAPAITLLGVSWGKTAFVALALSLSSTALVLQVLDEKRELASRHGRAAFSLLIFQDLAAIPLIAVVPFLAVGRADGALTWSSGALAVGAVLLVALFGRYGLSTLYRLVASTGMREAMTASALLTVVGVVVLMEAAGLSAALGAFLAGALLADSPYRHQVQADIAPFGGLLLGLFFTAIGMALNLNLLTEQPGVIAGAVVVMLTIKAAVLYALGRWRGLEGAAARRLALAASQGGEFAFVMFTTALGQNVIERGLADLLSVIVTMSMLATPLLLLIDDLLSRKAGAEAGGYDDMPDEQGHVVIAGFGRFGQIVARVLSARGIPFTALDQSAAQVDFVARFGAKAYYGDASRLDILQAAQTDRARAFVLAIDDVEASLRTAEVVRRHFPDVPVYARARNRLHVHKLLDAGVTVIHRETFLAAIELTREVLRGLNFRELEITHMLETFRELDRRRLYDDYAYYTDAEKLAEQARLYTAELEELFTTDAEAFGPAAAEEQR